jgi:ATP-dependent Clp protease ATP-binding subunit ClpA
MRTEIEQIIRRGSASRSTGPDLPYTSRAKTVLELAMKESRQLGHSYVGSEHLLLGLLSEGKGVAAQVLTNAGLTAVAAREAILRILGSEGALHPSHPSQGELSPRHIPNLVVVQLRYEGGWTHRREFRTAAEAMAFLADR